MDLYDLFGINKKKVKQKTMKNYHLDAQSMGLLIEDYDLFIRQKRKQELRVSLSLITFYLLFFIYGFVICAILLSPYLN